MHVSASVLIWDQKRERAEQIVELLSREGILCRMLNSTHDVRNWNESTSVALVSLGKTTQDQQQAFELIVELRRLGHLVLAFEDGVTSWPLRARCRLLLAGAKELHDSGHSDSLPVFCRQVRTLRETIEKSLHEESSTKETFRSLGIVGVSAAMIGLERLVLRVSRLSDVAVLISGESGTGKELFARAIHALDPRRSAAPFVPVNCAALPKDLAEAELFGHRRGAFTGAELERKGIFRAADGGVVFLDEIGEMRLDLQAKLLRVLQESRVLPLGEDREIAINVRVIAATNQELRSSVAEGTFREDLFHRLNVVPLHIPSLRERPEDIAVLVEHFLAKHRVLCPWGSKAAAEFVEGLQKSRLKGNAREVENIIRKALAGKDHEAPLGLGDLPPHLWRELSEGTTEELQEKISPAEPISVAEFEPSNLFGRVLKDNDWNLVRSVKRCERLLLEAAMQRTGGNQSETARLLGVTPRSIYNKLRQHPSNC